MAADEEYLIYLAESQDQHADPEKILQAKQFTRQIRATAEGLIQCINYFPLFGEHYSQRFVFDVITYWCKNRSESLSEELWALIRQIIFVSAIEKYNDFEIETAQKLAEAQAQFSLKSYQNLYPDIFQIALQIPNIAILRFISQLSDILSCPSPRLYDSISEYKNLINTNGITNEMVRIVTTNVTRGVNEAFRSLKSIVKWTDLNWINDEDLLEEIYDGIDKNETMPFVISFYTTIMMRMENREQLFIDFKIIDHYNSMLNNDTNELECLMAFAEMINKCGPFFIGTQHQADLYNIATVLISTHDSIASTVVSYIDLFTSRNHEICETSLSTAITRLQAYFESNPINLSPLCSQLTHLAYTCFLVNSELSESFLADQISPENFPLTASLLFILYDVISLGIKVNNIHTFYVSYREFLDIEPPINDIQIYAPLISYLKLPLVVTNLAQIDYPSFYDSLFTLISSHNIDPVMNHKFLSLFTQFVHRFAREIEFNDNPEQLMEILNPDIASVLASIINAMTIDQRIQQITVYINKISTLLQQVEDKRIVFQCAFSFLSTIKLDQTTLELVQAFLINSHHSVAEDDELLAQCIHAIRCLGIAGIPLFLEIVPNSVDSRATIISAVSTAREFKIITEVMPESTKIEANIEALNDEWVSPFTTTVMNVYLQIMDNVKSEAYQDDELIPFFSMSLSVLSFLSKVIPCLTAEQVTLVINLINDFADRYYESPGLFEGLVGCATAIATVYQEITINNLFSPLTNCFLAPSFDPNCTKWMKVLRKITKLWSYLVRADASFQEVFSHRMYQIGVSAEVISQMLEVLSNIHNVDDFQPFYFTILMARGC